MTRAETVPGVRVRVWVYVQKRPHGPWRRIARERGVYATNHAMEFVDGFLSAREALRRHGAARLVDPDTAEILEQWEASRNATPWETEA